VCVCECVAHGHGALEAAVYTSDWWRAISTGMGACVECARVCMALCCVGVVAVHHISHALTF
jgi:hypothetical protein